MAVFATFPASNPSGYESVLLALALMGCEESLTAEDHYIFLKFMLSVQGKKIDSVVALVGNNENINKALGCRVGPAIVGSHSQRLNPDVKDILAEYSKVVNKVRILVQSFSYNIPFSKLRKLTPLRQMVRNDPHWSSLFEMYICSVQLPPFGPQAGVLEIQRVCPQLGRRRSSHSAVAFAAGPGFCPQDFARLMYSVCQGCILFEGVMKKHPST